MNHLLVLLPEEFNCYTKLERKLDRISSSLMNFKITTNSPNELLKLYQEHNRDCIEISYLPDWKSVEFTHAVIFKDDEIFNDDEEYIRLLNIPLRIIQIKITRVINIDTDMQYKNADSRALLRMVFAKIHQKCGNEISSRNDTFNNHFDIYI